MTPAEIFIRIDDLTADQVRQVAYNYLNDVDIALAAVGHVDSGLFPDYNTMRGWYTFPPQKQKQKQKTCCLQLRCLAINSLTNETNNQSINQTLQDLLEQIVSRQIDRI